ncbi:leukemia inhibitory factor receptor [Megalops cyprinoides]|uniref:leukemia inhibitory factor receptor n=1 Tax=Megalops cyprinoides TaxID=118141 RepID=UPI001863ECE5|nr:leukemia inhibitory factor receptor [Megalops cyprinoides]
MIAMPWVVHVLLLVVCSEYQRGWCFESAPAPSIIELYPDNRTQSLVVKWWPSQGASKESNATFEIQVGRTENVYVVHKANVSVTLPRDTKPLVWKWVSELPLQCTDHSVRIRRLFNDTFASDWSPWKTNLGEQELRDQPWDAPKLFPFQQVLKEGSSGHFCCVPRHGTHIVNVSFSSEALPMIPIGERVKAIVVENLNATGCYGVNFGCLDSEDMEEQCLNYVTFPPQKPRNINCETRDMRTVNCSWNPGRLPNLLEPYKRIYTLHVLNSRNPISCKDSISSCGMAIPGGQVYTSSCSFKAVPGQQVYTVTIRVRNDLGEESKSITFNLSDRVVPVPVHVVVDPGVRQADVSWTLQGNLSGFALSCQIRTDPDSSVVDMELQGRLDGRYESRVEGLRPCTLYSASVRCAVTGRAWRWGAWADSQFYTHPCVELDVWSQIRPHAQGRNVTVLWRKHCNGTEPNVSIQEYRVEWEQPEQQETVGVNGDETQIKFSISPSMCIISVTAICQCGSSLSHQITIPPAAHRERLLQARRVNGSTTEGFWLSWATGTNVTCGYLVQWCQRGSARTCDLQWEKVTAGSTSLLLPAGYFRAGCRYTFEIFGCRTDGHWLLEAQTGYTMEQKPAKSPQLLGSSTTTPSSVTLEWSFDEEDPMHTGFITGYLVTVQEKTPSSTSNGHMQSSYSLSVDDPRRKTLTVKDLKEDSEYTFFVGACTAVGVGPLASCTVRTPPNYSLLLVKILTPAVLLLGLGFLLWPHGKMLVDPIKEVFRTPMKLKVKTLELDSALYEASEKIKALQAEECNCSQIEVMELEKKLLLGPEGSCHSASEDNPSCCPYCPQGPTGTWKLPENQKVMSLTNLTYCPGQTLGPSTSPYVSLCDVGILGEPKRGAEDPSVVATMGYITTAEIPQ